MTNAHVVAGEQDTHVLLRGHGPSLDATVIAFDPHDDVAVLRVSGLDAPPLRFAEPADGHRGRDPRLPARRARSTCAPGASASRAR